MKSYRERKGKRQEDYPYQAPPQNYSNYNYNVNMDVHNPVVIQPAERSNNNVDGSKGYCSGTCCIWTTLSVVFMIIIVLLFDKSAHSNHLN